MRGIYARVGRNVNAVTARFGPPRKRATLMPSVRRYPGTIRPALLWASILVAGALVFVPSDASASRGEMNLRLAGALANANATSDAGAQFGAAGRATAVFDVADLWSLHLGAEGAHHFAAKPDERRLPPLTIQNAFGGFRYNLDVFTYVPYFGLSAITYLPGPPSKPGGGVRPRVGAKLSVGVDWRFARFWSTGIIADLHAVDLDFGGFPSYSSVGFNIAYHFRL